MTKTKTDAVSVLAKIEAEAKTHSNDLRMVRTMEVGQWVRQGDIHVERIEKMPTGLKARSDRQLALGATQGSRHVCESGPKLYDLRSPNPLQGPLVDAPERFVVTHPEHAHVSLPRGLYAVTYQRDFAEEEIAAVRD